MAQTNIPDDIRSQIEEHAVSIALEETALIHAETLKRVQDILGAAQNMQDAAAKIAAQFKDGITEAKAETIRERDAAARVKAELDIISAKLSEALSREAALMDKIGQMQDGYSKSMTEMMDRMREIVQQRPAAIETDEPESQQMSVVIPTINVERGYDGKILRLVPNVN